MLGSNHHSGHCEDGNINHYLSAQITDKFTRE